MVEVSLNRLGGGPELAWNGLALLVFILVASTVASQTPMTVRAPVAVNAGVLLTLVA